MKIAIWHNLPSGGGKRALYGHVKGLIERGHTVEAWCPETADQAYLPLGELITEHRLPFSWRHTASRNPFVRVTSPYRRIVDHLRALDEHCRQCAAAINSGGFDLLFANSCMYFRASAIGRYVDLPSVIYLQEPYRWLYEALPQLPWVAAPAPGRRWWRPAFLKQALRDSMQVHGLRIQAREELISARAFDAILVNSLYSRESILRAYGLDAKVCYLGVDTILFTDQHLEREDVLVGVGAFVREKNIRFVLEAVAAIPPPRPRLIWIGNVAVPSYLSELQQVAAARGVDFEPKVRIDDQELVGILNRALAMVYTPRLEPFGYAPVEAGACALPVIAVAEGGVRETVIDGVNGLLVEHTPSAMALAIERLRADRAFAGALGAQGRRLAAQQWSLDASINRLERRFAETLAQSHSSRRPDARAI